MNKCECELCGSDFPFGCGASPRAVAFHYGRLQAALRAISDACPIIEAVMNSDSDEMLSDVLWKSTKRRRKLAREALNINSQLAARARAME